MVILALDTSTPAVTAGVVTLADEARELATEVTVNPRAHGELLTPHVQSAVRGAGSTLADVAAIVCGAGPGPFTGLRAGLATAAALGQALHIPVYPVCSLDAIAAAARADVDTAGPAVGAGVGAAEVAGAAGAEAAGAEAAVGAAGELLVVTDARRREVYWARYNVAGQRIAGPNVTRPDDVEIGDATAVAGHGVHVDPDAFALPAIEPAYPTPLGLVLAAADDVRGGREPAQLTPLYLRRPHAQVPGERKRVTV